MSFKLIRFMVAVSSVLLSKLPLKDKGKGLGYEEFRVNFKAIFTVMKENSIAKFQDPDFLIFRPPCIIGSWRNNRKLFSPDIVLSFSLI